ncbi:MAG: hypothetical protein V4714_11495 [Bacteroidota bacterium]
MQKHSLLRSTNESHKIDDVLSRRRFVKMTGVIPMLTTGDVLTGSNRNKSFFTDKNPGIKNNFIADSH